MVAGTRYHRRRVARLDCGANLTDICHMANAAKKTSDKPVKRSARTGQFLGRTEDGLLIPRPAFKPENFTLRELDRAIRAAKQRQAIERTR